MTTSDLVAKLRQTVCQCATIRWDISHGKRKQLGVYMLEAADEIEALEEMCSAWESDRDNWRAAFHACELDAKKAEARVEKLERALEWVWSTQTSEDTAFSNVCRQALAEDGKAPDQTDQSGEPS